MSETFIHGPDWQCSSGPIVSRQFQLVDLWPEGAHNSDRNGDRDVLADGDHPVLAIGPKANRPRNLTGVVISYNSAANLVQMNLADKVCVKQYVANVLTYDRDGTPLTFDQSMAIGEPVYVDDSDALGDGTTLSRSPLNSIGSKNPLAGYLFYCQDEYQDYGVGGPNASAVWPKALDAALDQSEYCVLLVNDFGDAPD